MGATGFLDPIPQGYDGLNWTNIAVIGKDCLASLGLPNSGYSNVVTSGVAGGDATVVMDPTKAFVDFQHETATGAVSASFSGRFTSIDEVLIEGSGGINAGLGASGG